MFCLTATCPSPPNHLLENKSDTFRLCSMIRASSRSSSRRRYPRNRASISFRLICTITLPSIPYGDISTELQFLRKKRLHILHFRLVSFLFLFQIQHSLIQLLSNSAHPSISYTNLFGQRIRETGRRRNGHFLFRIAFTHSTNRFYRNGGIHKGNEEPTPAVHPMLWQQTEDKTTNRLTSRGSATPPSSG